MSNEEITSQAKGFNSYTHVRCGNYRSTWVSSGEYEPDGKYLFARETVDLSYLEFDDERSGDFEPLRCIPKDKRLRLA